MKYLRDNIDSIIILGLFAVGIACMGIAVVGSYINQKNWTEWAEAHGCVVSGHVSGDLITGVSSNGSMVTATTPDKTAYTCSDGVTYWR